MKRMETLDLSCFNEGLASQRWEVFSGLDGNNTRLSVPSDCAIFCENNLYLFVEREGKKRAGSEKVFEDVYVLDLVGNDKMAKWRRVSPGGEVPGLLTNVSMAADNGIIYIFGTKSQKTVLWIYDTNGETWNEVKDVDLLTAGPNQRAVVYKNQLLIVTWSYPSQVTIQSQSLDTLNFVVPLSIKKQICRDQPGSFIQHSKNLYNGRLFADITFQVEGEEIPAHKAILAYRSNYFMKMFTSKG